MPEGPLYEPPPLNMTWSPSHEMPPPLMNTEELHQTNQALRHKIFMRDKTAQNMTGQTNNDSTQFTRSSRLLHSDDTDLTGPTPRRPTRHDPTAYSSQMGPHLRNIRDSTGYSSQMETPELEEIHEANMQVHREYVEALRRTEAQWEELWRREDRAREREEIRSFANLESRFWLDFAANRIPEEEWMYARGDFEPQTVAPLPPLPPTAPIQRILARPGTAAREAQDRRHERIRNFLANGVNPR